MALAELQVVFERNEQHPTGNFNGLPIFVGAGVSELVVITSGAVDSHLGEMEFVISL